MSVAYYFDHHMPLVIATTLRERGIDVLTAREDHYDLRPDEELLLRATELGRVVVSQDHDFLQIAHDWQTRGQPFAGVVFSHPMRSSLGSLISDLEIAARAMTSDEFDNAVVWIPF